MAGINASGNAGFSKEFYRGNVKLYERERI